MRSCRPLLGLAGAVVCVEGGAESPCRVVQARAGRPDRDTEDVGDLGERQAHVVLENEDGPLVRLELPEPTLHLIAVGDRGELVGRT